MSRTTKRGLDAAIKAACLSKFTSHRVGAALFYKKNLIALGWNKRKTHPQCPTEHSQHAEFNVCINVDDDLFRKGLTLYVARIKRSGQIGIAKPCKDCRDFLKTLGIKKIWYTTNEGILEQLWM